MCTPIYYIAPTNTRQTDYWFCVYTKRSNSTAWTTSPYSSCCPCKILLVVFFKNFSPTLIVSLTFIHVQVLEHIQYTDTLKFVPWNNSNHIMSWSLNFFLSIHVENSSNGCSCRHNSFSSSETSQSDNVRYISRSPLWYSHFLTCRKDFSVYSKWLV